MGPIKNGFCTFITESTKDGYWVLNRTGKLIDANSHYLHLSGYSLSEIPELSLYDLLCSKDSASLTERILTISPDSYDSFTTEHARVDGTLLSAEMHIIACPIESDNVMVFIRDVSNVHNDLTRLKIIENIFQHSTDAIMVTDKNGHIQLVNKTFTQTTGYPQSEVYGKTPKILQSGRQSKEFYDAMWHKLLTDGLWVGEIWNKRKNDEIYPQWLTISNIKDNTGATSHFIAQFRDISKRKHTEEVQRFQALHDPLTHLPNRTLLFERLDDILAQSNNKNTVFAVLFCDLDHFKLINDTLGHQVGDDLLKAVATRLENNLRTKDIIARTGGDEFIIVINGAKAVKNIDSILHNLLKLFESPFNTVHGSFFISMSIGVSRFPNDSSDIKQLIYFSDIAMSQVKAKGGDHYSIFETKQKAKLLHKIELEQYIHQALKNQQFKVYYQPQINSLTNEVYGVECLLRWEHPEHGFISPELFIPIAEGNNLIKEIGIFVFTTALRQLRQWRLDNVFMGIMAINVSLKQFERNDLFNQVVSTLTDELVPANAIEIEVTESLFTEDNLHYVSVLRKLRALGVKIAIDDFGTGYSSLQRLKELPVDNIKIDKCFVDNITTSKEDVSIVQAIKLLSASFGVETIAEGVETKAQADTLTKMGCNHHQGFLYSKALPAESFEAWLKAHNDHHHNLTKYLR